MNFVIIMILIGIFLYTLGFGVSLWKGKQKMAAIATIFLCLLIIVLPFFSIFKT